MGRMKGTWRWPRTSLLGTLTETSRRRLLESGTMREYAPDRRLLAEGELSTFVIVLLEGIVKATSVTAEGKEVLLAIRVGGDIVGEFAAMDGRPRSSTVTTSSVVVGSVITQADFIGLLRKDEQLARKVDGSVIAKMRSANERRMEFAGYDAHTRVARVLRDLVAVHGDRTGNRIVLGWPLTQTELASLAAVAEPTVQKVLRALRESKVITTGYRTLTVEDFAELNKIAGL